MSVCPVPQVQAKRIRVCGDGKEMVRTFSRQDFDDIHELIPPLVFLPFNGLVFLEGERLIKRSCRFPLAFEKCKLVVNGIQPCDSHLFLRCSQARNPKRPETTIRAVRDKPYNTIRLHIEQTRPRFLSHLLAALVRASTGFHTSSPGNPPCKSPARTSARVRAPVHRSKSHPSTSPPLPRSHPPRASCTFARGLARSGMDSTVGCWERRRGVRARDARSRRGTIPRRDPRWRCSSCPWHGGDVRDCRSAARSLGPVRWGSRCRRGIHGTSRSRLRLCRSR